MAGRVVAFPVKVESPATREMKKEAREIVEEKAIGMTESVSVVDK